MKKILKKICLILILSSLVNIRLSADAFFKVPESFYALGPSLSYSFSENLKGPTLSFEATKTWYFFSLSGGMRYIFSKDDGNDFRGNNGLISLYAEATAALPMPLGIGISYHFLVNGGSGFGLSAYYSLPIPIPKAGYISLFYRPSWVWLDGNCEVINEIGIYFKFSNLFEAWNKINRRKPYMRTNQSANTNK
ncbi:MAG: hypothetical protein KAS64_06060 [Spirochaetes bacterium]|nr:hypothetical protein [Spirochaetota bacterium]